MRQPTPEESLKIRIVWGRESEVQNHIFEYIHKELRWLKRFSTKPIAIVLVLSKQFLQINNLTGKQIYSRALVY